MGIEINEEYRDPSLDESITHKGFATVARWDIVDVYTMYDRFTREHRDFVLVELESFDKIGKKLGQEGQ